MLEDITGTEIGVGDEVIITVNNRGLTRVIITKITKGGVYYNVVDGYNILAVKQFLHLRTANKNMYKIC